MALPPKEDDNKINEEMFRCTRVRTTDFPWTKTSTKKAKPRGRSGRYTITNKRGSTWFVLVHETGERARDTEGAIARG